MRIFLTGATSLIGTAVAPALVKAGHHVTAILRPTGPVPARLRTQGIDVLTGDLSDIGVNRSALEATTRWCTVPATRRRTGPGSTGR